MAVKFLDPLGRGGKARAISCSGCNRIRKKSAQKAKVGERPRSRQAQLLFYKERYGAGPQHAVRSTRSTHTHTHTQTYTQTHTHSSVARALAFARAPPAYTPMLPSTTDSPSPQSTQTTRCRPEVEHAQGQPSHMTRRVHTSTRVRHNTAHYAGWLSRDK
jgi:hypothetical protein